MGLNSRRLFLTVRRTDKSEIRVLAASVPGENSFPGFSPEEMALFLLFSHLVERHGTFS